MEKKLSIIVFSGDFDKITAALTIATGAAATGYKVNLFFTFWGLNAIKEKKGHSAMGKGFMARIINFVMGGMKCIPTSRMNLFGASPKIFRRMMRSKNVATPEKLLESAIALGIEIYACEMAMVILGLKKSDLIHEVSEVVGVTTFLNISEGGRTLFI